ncbi:hypothetical protein C8Q76DRAFT_596216, partial [Earliella scabrosa]
RRQVWVHAFEKSIFTPEEIETMSIADRRPIYIATLEAYIEILLLQLHDIGGLPVSAEELAMYSGLHDVTAK